MFEADVIESKSLRDEADVLLREHVSQNFELINLKVGEMRTSFDDFKKMMEERFTAIETQNSTTSVQVAKNVANAMSDSSSALDGIDEMRKQIRELLEHQKESNTLIET